MRARSNPTTTSRGKPWKTGLTLNGPSDKQRNSWECMDNKGEHVHVRSMNGGESLRKRFDDEGVNPKFFCKRPERVSRDAGRRVPSALAAEGSPAA